MEKKYFWSNRWVFILAAIGSAAGLGNLWRFPFQVYDYGWWAFILAYLIILFIMGLGLLIWEVAFGQYTQKWAPEAFGTVSKYLKWLGWFAIFIWATILTYYVVVIWWWMDYLWYSIKALFDGVLPWADNAQKFFLNNVLHLTDSVDIRWNISIPVLIWTLVSWILIYLFTFKSTKSVWKVVLVTATVPFITLFILALRGITLPGAEQGLAYLFHIDWSKFFSIDTWKAAAGQIFFTLSLAMGIMIAYGALKKRDSEIVQSVVLVALGNTLISFLSAFAVFGTLGYLALQQWVPVDKVVKWWPMLAFVVFPETIALMSTLQTLFAIIFFATVFFLAIDSAMSLIEAVSVAIRDKFPKVKVEIITLVVTILLAIVSIIYTFGNGLYILDIVDHFITRWWMLFVWVLEWLVFLYLGKKLIDFIISHSKCKIFIFNTQIYYYISWLFSVVVLGYLLISQFISEGIKYWTYPLSYIKVYGIWVVIGLLILSVVINLLDILKDNKDE